MDFNRIITEAYNNPSVVGYLKNLCGDDWDEIRQGAFEKILGYPDTVMLAHEQKKVPQLIITCCRNYYYDTIAKKKPVLIDAKAMDFLAIYQADVDFEEKKESIDWAIDILFEGMNVDFNELYSICDVLDNNRRNALVKAGNELKEHKHPNHFRGLIIKSIFKAGVKIVSETKQGRPENAERLLSRQTGIPLKIIQQIKNEYFNTM
jgi:hypothetical protein